jgi:hypothetical protein
MSARQISAKATTVTPDDSASSRAAAAPSAKPAAPRDA